jgi:hypothetical protein
MCYGKKSAPQPATTPPQVAPPVSYPDGSQDGVMASEQQRKRAAGAKGIKSTIVTSSEGLSNRLANTAKTSGGLLS